MIKVNVHLMGQEAVFDFGTVLETSFAFHLQPGIKLDIKYFGINPT
jgi:hypothetical protein